MQGNAALCLSVAIITSSSLTEVKSDNGNVGPYVPLSRHVQAQFPTQEFDRKASMCTMVFGHKVLHAQLNEDSLTISTRTVTADKLSTCMSAFILVAYTIIQRERLNPLARSGYRAHQARTDRLHTTWTSYLILRLVSVYLSFSSLVNDALHF